MAVLARQFSSVDGSSTVCFRLARPGINEMLLSEHAPNPADEPRGELGLSA
jgi:hypothetical protein